MPLFFLKKIRIPRIYQLENHACLSDLIQFFSTITKIPRRFSLIDLVKFYLRLLIEIHQNIVSLSTFRQIKLSKFLWSLRNDNPIYTTSTCALAAVEVLVVTTYIYHITDQILILLRKSFIGMLSHSIQSLWDGLNLCYNICALAVAIRFFIAVIRDQIWILSYL